MGVAVKVELKLTGDHRGARTLEVNGVDISQMATDVSISIDRHEPVKMHVELCVVEDLDISGEARLYLHSSVHDLLVKWGWTPPEHGAGVRSEYD